MCVYVNEQIFMSSRKASNLLAPYAEIDSLEVFQRIFHGGELGDELKAK